VPVVNVTRRRSATLDPHRPTWQFRAADVVFEQHSQGAHRILWSCHAVDSSPAASTAVMTMPVILTRRRDLRRVSRTPCGWRRMGAGYREGVRSERVAAGRTVRWLLLACTVLGLAAMHSLGHGSHADGGHGEQLSAAGHGESPSGAPAFVAAMSQVEAAFTAVLAAAPAVLGGACSGDCHGAAGGSGRPRDDMSGFTVCLAVLAAFGIAVLLAWLRLRTPAPAWARGLPPARWVASRAAPPAGVGLQVAALSVMRI
jgi:hypothetical protein